MLLSPGKSSEACVLAGSSPATSQKRSAASMEIVTSGAQARKSFTPRSPQHVASSCHCAAGLQRSEPPAHTAAQRRAARIQEVAAPRLAAEASRAEELTQPTHAAQQLGAVGVSPCTTPRVAGFTAAAVHVRSRCNHGGHVQAAARTLSPSNTDAKHRAGLEALQTPRVAHLSTATAVTSASPDGSSVSDLDVPCGEVHATMATLADALLAPCKAVLACETPPSAPLGVGEHTQDEQLVRPSANGQSHRVDAHNAAAQPEALPRSAAMQLVDTAPRQQGQPFVRSAACAQGPRRPALTHALCFLESNSACEDQRHASRVDINFATAATPANKQSPSRKTALVDPQTSHSGETEVPASCDAKNLAGTLAPPAQQDHSLQRLQQTSRLEVDPSRALGLAKEQRTPTAAVSTKHGSSTPRYRRLMRKGGWEKRRRLAATAKEQ